MSRRIYLLLVLVRLYFALSPSYIHPDEMFQGPEAIAGHIFSYPVHLTWEFTDKNPIRSVFPLWPVYGLPMLIISWLWDGLASQQELSPSVVFLTLRLLMFLLSFILGDWALHELIASSKHRKIALLLTASSYVTWTYQTHTFSNSLETLLVAWSLVLIERILQDKSRSKLAASGLLGFVIVCGIFNRITFPAYVFVPGCKLLLHSLRKPLSLLATISSAALTSLIAIYVDTIFYAPSRQTTFEIISDPIITPLNNLMYNLEPSNLALHGVHPYYQHMLVNLPQLLGPATLLLFTSARFTSRLISAIAGVVTLSAFSHQEARFLIPAIPLILSSVNLPRKYTRLWIAIWVLFNTFFGFLMGVFHQGGVIPTQMALSSHRNATQAFWWKTYIPPTWLLGNANNIFNTTDLMGMPESQMIQQLQEALPCSARSDSSSHNTVYLVAPRSSTSLDRYTSSSSGVGTNLLFREVHSYRNHINLDDLDIPEEGIAGTMDRVIGRRGLTTWEVSKVCK